VDFNLIQLWVLSVVIMLVFSLYREWFNPALSFFIAVIALLVTQVISPAELLRGLSNQQIIVIFLLILVTAGIRSLVGPNLFGKLFNPALKPKAFLARMMVTVSSLSALLNNTPIVAFMIPFVKEWSDRSGHPVSKFLIPLSFATILGGMITVIGTSTNLVLLGLMSEYNLPLLHYTDFLYLGLLAAVVGLVYLFFIGYTLLPANQAKIDSMLQNLKAYIVETEIFEGSTLIGKTVKEAGLRNLQDLFLVEIIRDTKVISPVSPDEKVCAGDALFFSGHTQSIFNLINEDNGMRLPRQEKLEREQQFNFVEAVIPAGSELIGVRIKDSDFRRKYNASIVAIHRDGKRVSGKVGEMQISGGDFMLLLSGVNHNPVRHEKDLFFVSVPRKIESAKTSWKTWLGIGSITLLILGITGLLPLFTACLIILTIYVFSGVLSVSMVRLNLDLNLLMVLVCSLAIGVALEKSGTAALIASGLITVGESVGTVAVLSALFIVTILLTSLVTNPAAVSIMFPVAMALADQLQMSGIPFFVAIAFAASGDFMTPIGYQTNLMVYGPGGYTFKDFVKVGTPLTLLYSVLCIGFITWYYGL
jgi:di/tricarboxylate transporter